MKSKVIAGIMVTMFLVTVVFSGIPVRAAVQEIYVGVVGPKGMVQWFSQIGGAEIALPKANLLLTGNYHINLVEIDEHAYPTVDPAAAAQAMGAALASGPHPDGSYGLDFIVGGFRTECVYGMIYYATDPYYAAYHDKAPTYKQPVWYISGAATDALMNPVTRPYLFRVTPINTTFLVSSLVSILAMHLLPYELKAIYGAPVKTYTVIESLTWCDAMPKKFRDLLNYTSGTYPYCDFVGGARPAWDETDFSTILTDIKNKGAHLVIHIFSALGGVPFTKQFGESQVPAILIGINVESQPSTFYETIGGKCENEAFLATVGTRTPVSKAWGSDDTTEFWDAFVALKGRPPIYTAFGCHDGLMGFAEFLKYNATSWPMNYTDFIPILEQTERRGLTGTFRFDSSHDAFSVDTGPTWSSPYRVRALVTQWQAGNLEVTWPRDKEFSRKYQIPSWMYDHADTDWYGANAGMTIGPDGLVDILDLDKAAEKWQKAPYPYVEADMDGNNFINILDISTVAIDNGYNASLPGNYGQWPLP